MLIDVRIVAARRFSVFRRPTLSFSTRRRRPEADQYGNLTDIDRVERDE